MRLTRMPIFLRLLLAFVMAAVIPGIVIAVLGGIFSSTLLSRGQAMQTVVEANNTASTAFADLERMNALLIAYHSTAYTNQNDPSMRTMAQNLDNQILDLENNFGAAATKYQQNYLLASSPGMSNVQQIVAGSHPGLAADQQATVQQVVNQLWPGYKQSQDAEVVALKAHLPHAQAFSLLNTANANYQTLSQSWQHIMDLTATASNDVSNSGSAQVGTVSLGTAIAVLLTAIIIITTGYVVSRTITNPLRQLSSLTKRISRGDTSARAKITTRDEIYIVANSMNNMLDNIVRLIQETQAQRDVLQAQVEKLVSEVSGVGEGDLRIQAEVTADALGVLADSFNYMVEELGNLVVRVKTVAHEVENSMGTVIDRMGQLVEDNEVQIEQIGEAAVVVERVADSSRLVAERAQALQNVAIEARQDAQGGREAVGQAVEGMGRIHDNVQTTAAKVQLLGERSREINNIVEAMSGIAHQTNRLALDAAIQAAMAGENGKGFGAVAADIRRLAERAKEQASSIARIVRSVREDIGAVAVSMQDTERETSAGARLTQEAGGALETIFSVVEQQASEIESINQVAMQQLQSAHSVVQIMHNVSDSTQRSSISTREASQYMERLSRLVEQLRASVEAFKLQEEPNYLAASAFSTTITPEHEESQLSVSGVFRTITATAQSQPAGRFAYNALPPGRSSKGDNGPQPTYSTAQPYDDQWDNLQLHANAGADANWNTPQPEEPWSNFPANGGNYSQNTGGFPPAGGNYPQNGGNWHQSPEQNQYDEWANSGRNR